MSTDPRFIVTGGAGFIGANIVHQLNRRGHSNVVVVDRVRHPGQQRNVDGLTFSERIDLDDFRQEVNNDTLDPVTTVFHMGACSATTETDETYMMDNNFNYTRELCEWCLRHGVRFIYASSAATYGDGVLGYSDDDAMTPRLQPLNVYGHSKQRFDRWALDRGYLDRIVGLKYFNVYGPHEDHKDDMRSVVNKAYYQVLDSGRIKLFKSARPDYEDGKQQRDFVFVRDAVAVTLYFHDHPEVSGLYNCGTGASRTWMDLAHAVFAAMDREPVIDFIDLPDRLREHYQYFTQADTTKLRNAGYTEAFTDLEQGVSDYIREYLARAPDKRPLV